jgi:DNA-binding FadR family transcriptional regulator
MSTPAPSQFNSKSLVARALAVLLRHIMDGEYKAMAHIPPQDVLAKDIGVSRSVIREALVILRFCNVVTIRPKVGTTINPAEQWKPLIYGVLEEQ